MSLTLVGCSTGDTTYASINDLKSSYTAAGGSCDNPAVFDKSDGGFASKTYICDGGVGLQFFENPSDIDKQLEKVREAVKTGKAKYGTADVIDKNWMVSTTKPSEMQKSLGGRIWIGE